MHTHKEEILIDIEKEFQEHLTSSDNETNILPLENNTRGEGVSLNERVSRLSC
jgi:hypothetical protein